MMLICLTDYSDCKHKEVLKVGDLVNVLMVTPAERAGLFLCKR